MVQVPCVDLCTDIYLLPPHVTLSTLLLLALLKFKSLLDDTTGCMLQNRVQPVALFFILCCLSVGLMSPFFPVKNLKKVQTVCNLAQETGNRLHLVYTLEHAACTTALKRALITERCKRPDQLIYLNYQPIILNSELLLIKQKIIFLKN